jgi:pimeloyl-ACP methyl ester carboxylesterase
MSATAAPPPIVLIHGLWMTPASWEGWQRRFEERGHRVLAPAWPRMDKPLDQLRAHPEQLAGLGIAEILDHYEAIIRGLDTPPIVIGHSFGGLFAQLLLARGLGVAGVGLDAATPKGITTLPLSTIRASSPLLANPLNKGKAKNLTPKQFRYAFTNTLSEPESLTFYERYAAPGIGEVLFEGAMANFNPKASTKIEWAAERAPLLLIAGEHDHVIPPKATRAIYKHQSRSPSITAYQEFAGRPHGLGFSPGWEEIADYALEWALDPKASAP